MAKKTTTKKTKATANNTKNTKGYCKATGGKSKTKGGSNTIRKNLLNNSSKNFKVTNKK